MMKRSTLNNWIKAFFWGAIITGALLMANYCNAATTSKNQKTCWLPEGCTVQYSSNPYMYIAGTLANVSNVDGNLNLRFKPLGTYSLYDEEIMLCGLPIEKFRGVEETMVLTYRRRVTHLVDGVGCHELIRVDSVTLTKGLQ